jgi:hypothetical protein
VLSVSERSYESYREGTYSLSVTISMRELDT